MRIRHLITVITHECQGGSISFNKQYGCLISLFNHSSGFWQRWRGDARLSSEGESETERSAGTDLKLKFCSSWGQPEYMHNSPIKAFISVFAGTPSLLLSLSALLKCKTNKQKILNKGDYKFKITSPPTINVRVRYSRATEKLLSGVSSWSTSCGRSL